MSRRKNLTFFTNENAHKGTLSKESDVYTMDFDDRDRKMEAIIIEDKLNIRIVDAYGKLTFEKNNIEFNCMLER